MRLRDIRTPPGTTVDLAEDETPSGVLRRAVVRNAGTEPVAVGEVTLVLEARFERVLEHGWQSWSMVRPTGVGDVLPVRASAPYWGRALLAADPAALGSRVAGEPFLLGETGIAGFLEDGGHLSSVTQERDELHCRALLDGVVLAPGEERALAPLLAATGEPSRLYTAFLDAWGQHAGARTASPAPVGWCSWYRYGTQVDPAHVRAAAALCAEHDLRLVQLDDGYAPALGDWLAPSARWPAGPLPLAAELRDRGLQAGVWTAPFLAAADSEVARAHPDWLLRDSAGELVTALVNKDWPSVPHVLDPTRADVREHLRQTFAVLSAAGYSYFKLDFCYAAATGGSYADPTATRAQALRQGLAAVREGVGEDAFVLGCGSPFGPAIGLVDSMRVSADTQGFWHAEAPWDGYAGVGPGLRNAMASSVARAPMHRRLWVNDPDCLLLRPELPEAVRDLSAALVAGTGGAVIVSDDLTAYGAREWDLLATVRTVAAAADGQSTLRDPLATPAVVDAGAVVLDADWQQDGRASVTFYGDVVLRAGA